MNDHNWIKSEMQNHRRPDLGDIVTHEAKVCFVMGLRWWGPNGTYGESDDPWGVLLFPMDETDDGDDDPAFWVGCSEINNA